MCKTPQKGPGCHPSVLMSVLLQEKDLDDVPGLVKYVQLLLETFEALACECANTSPPADVLPAVQSTLATVMVHTTCTHYAVSHLSLSKCDSIKPSTVCIVSSIQVFINVIEIALGPSNCLMGPWQTFQTTSAMQACKALMLMSFKYLDLERAGGT